MVLGSGLSLGESLISTFVHTIENCVTRKLYMRMHIMIGSVQEIDCSIKAWKSELLDIKAMLYYTLGLFNFNVIKGYKYQGII